MNEKKINEARAKIAGLFREKRLALNVTQSQLAEETGMGIATIQRFESGRFWLNSKQLVILARRLEIEKIGV